MAEYIIREGVREIKTELGDTEGVRTEREVIGELIRCRNCVHWDKTWTNDFSPNYHYCPMVDGVRKDNFYCADAERREE